MRLADIIFSTDFVYSVIRISTPIIFAALGSLITAKAGIINIGIEGIMLCGALAGVIFSAMFQSAWIGLLAAIVIGILISMLMSYVILVLRSDITLTGIAMNMFGSGVTVFILYLVAHDKGISSSLPSKVLPNIDIPGFDKIPFVGNILSGQNVLTYIALLSVLVISILIRKSVLGLRIRSVGENEEASLSTGVSPRKYRLIAMIISGILAGMGGAYMSMSYVSWFSRDMIAGRGFIGLAAQQLGQGTTSGTFLSAIIFSIADAIANNLQALQLPTELVQSIPYTVTIIGLVFFSVIRSRNEQRRRKNKDLVSSGRNSDS